MSKNNGQRYGPRTNHNQRQGLRSVRDERTVYGARCTWWGGIADAKVVKAGLIDPRSRHPGDLIPVCPGCKGPLLEVPNEDAFWKAVGWFERGEHGVQRPHPGYTDFMKWMRRRCFRDILLATVAYKSQTGVDIDLDPADFSLPDRVEGCTCVEGRMDLCPFCLEELAKHKDAQGEHHAEICESED